jgi:hypothetical protein
VLATVAGGGYLGSRFATFRYFFAFPSGGTWANTVASVEWTLIVLFAVWYFRGSLGPRISAWWDSHHGDKHELRHGDTRKHISDEMVSLWQHIDEQFDELKRLIRGAGGD